jgi:FkbM family methyltransferase
VNIVKQCRYGKMIINRRDRWIGDSLDIYGEFSESEVEVFRKYVKPGDVVLDVGANIGAHTVVLSQLVGEKGLVVAFEPERYNYYTLCGNLALNNITNVIAFQQAVGEKKGTIKVPYINTPYNDNYGSLELDKDYSKIPHYTVPCSTIDGLELEKCNFIKLDIEGMEKWALMGGKETIKKFHPIMYIEDDREDKSKELREFISSLGYSIEEHNAPLFNPDNYNKEKYNVFGGIVSKNILCC